VVIPRSLGRLILLSNFDTIFRPENPSFRRGVVFLKTHTMLDGSGNNRFSDESIAVRLRFGRARHCRALASALLGRMRATPARSGCPGRTPAELSGPSFNSALRKQPGRGGIVEHRGRAGAGDAIFATSFVELAGQTEHFA